MGTDICLTILMGENLDLYLLVPQLVRFWIIWVVLEIQSLGQTCNWVLVLVLAQTEIGAASDYTKPCWSSRLSLQLFRSWGWSARERERGRGGEELSIRCRDAQHSSSTDSGWVPMGRGRKGSLVVCQRLRHRLSDSRCIKSKGMIWEADSYSWSISFKSVPLWH